jgi:septal ring factor EnvC (AmiA/AmiB activator)
MLALVRADADQLNAFAQSAERVRTAVAAVERDIEQLGHLKVELRAQEETLRAQRQARLDLLRQVRSERDLAMRAVAEVGVARGDLDQRLGTFDPAAMGAGGDAWHDAGVGSTGTFRDAYGRLPWPVHGRVIHRFGPYTDPSSGRPMTSQGLDIAADHGEPVRAVFSGRVQMAEYIRGFGQTVVLEHGPYVSLYAHLGSLRVSAGAPIRAGDVLGLVGNTGLTDEEGYMLSFQVRYNNSPQDPMLWLERR